MVWLPKKQALVTSSEVAHAKSLLPPNTSWHLGVIEEYAHIRYIGAMHPNASGSGSHPGVEVWTDVTADQHGATPMAEDFGTTSPEERELVLAAGMFYGYPRDELYHTVMIESAWKPGNYYHSKKVAPESAASGLIGFMPTTLKGLGWNGPRLPNGSVDMREFRKLSSKEQAQWVGRYFKGVAGRWKYPGDTYVAVAGSKFVGWPDDAVAYRDNPLSKKDAVDLNPGWNPNKDGEITVGEIRQTLINRLSKPVPSKVLIPDEWLSELSAKLDAYKPGGKPPAAPPKVEPDPALLYSREEWLSLLAQSLLSDAGKGRYAKLPAGTNAMLKEYQTYNRLKPDGILGPLTLAKLLS